MSDGRFDPAAMVELDQELADTEVAYEAAYQAMLAAQREAERTRNLFGRLKTWRDAVRRIRMEYLDTHPKDAP